MSESVMAGVCARCGQEACAPVHMVKSGHDFEPEPGGLTLGKVRALIPRRRGRSRR